MLKSVYLCSLVILVLLSTGLLLKAEEITTPANIRVVRVAGIINPVLADFISVELDTANNGNARAFLIELDTPGGLDSSMRVIIQKILASKIPVIVYVYPSGARAASAGALITLAADFAAMAPGTNIGAAHPVSIGIGGTGDNEQGNTVMEKVVNDAVAYARSLAEQRGRNRDWAEQIVRDSISTAAQEALELKAIDLIATDEQDLLKKLDDRTYLRNGKPRKLVTRGAVLSYAEMTWRNYIGVLLILLAIILFILEIKVVSYGMLTVGGLIALTFGSLILVDSPEPYLQISRSVIAATVLICASVISLVLFFVVRVQKTRFVSGLEGMIGERGQAVTALDPRGQVYVHGEYWDAHAEETIASGSEIEIVRSEANLKLLVRAVKDNSTVSTAKEKDYVSD